MSAPSKTSHAGNGRFVEEVEVRGHIIDSLILPKILDSIAGSGGSFRIKEIMIGQARNDPSHALLEVRADDEQALEKILAQIADQNDFIDASGCHLTLHCSTTGRHRPGLVLGKKRRDRGERPLQGFARGSAETGGHGGEMTPSGGVGPQGFRNIQVEGARKLAFGADEISAAVEQDAAVQVRFSRA